MKPIARQARPRQLVAPLLRRSGRDTEDSNLQTLEEILRQIVALLPQKVRIEVSLTTGTNKLRHNLGHAVNGWSVVDRNSAATVYRTPATDPTNEIWLVASAALTGVIEVW